MWICLKHIVITICLITDGIVTQRFNQQQQQRGGITTPRGAVSRRGRQQHPQSHKIHVNPHFKKSLQHPQQGMLITLLQVILINYLIECSKHI